MKDHKETQARQRSPVEVDAKRGEDCVSSHNSSIVSEAPTSATTSKIIPVHSIDVGVLTARVVTCIENSIIARFQAKKETEL